MSVKGDQKKVKQMRIENSPLENLQGLMDLEIRAGEHVGVGADDCLDDCRESDNVLKSAQEIMSELKSTPLQTLQEVTAVEQGAGVLQGAGVSSVIRCDPGFVTKGCTTKNEKFSTSNSTGADVSGARSRSSTRGGS